MKSKWSWKLLPLLIALTTFGAERPAKPNIVLMLIDDLGWQDVSCYDIDEPSPYETPHVDALAKRGGTVSGCLFAGPDVCAESLCDPGGAASGAVAEDTCQRRAAAQTTQRSPRPADRPLVSRGPSSDRDHGRRGAARPWLPDRA